MMLISSEILTSVAQCMGNIICQFQLQWSASDVKDVEMVVVGTSGKNHPK